MRFRHWSRVPLSLVLEAQQRGSTGYVDRAVRCRLSDHEGDDHYGLLTELDTYGTALWLRWHGTETALLALPDCPVTGPGPDGEGCCLFADHPEGHTWQHAPEVTSYAS